MDNTSGFRGVYEINPNCFRVGIGFKRDRFHVGTYSSFDEAVQARLESEERIHGGFVKVYYAWTVLKEVDPMWAEENTLIFEAKK